MESLQLARLLSCKACPIPPKLGPSLGFRPLRQVGFGSLWRNQTQYGLMARSSTSVDGGSSYQERSHDVENEEEAEGGLPPYEIRKSEENVGDIIKNQPLDNQLKEIKVELCKYNEEIKKLRETVQNPYWKHLSAAVLDLKNYKEILQKERQKEEQKHKIRTGPEPSNENEVKKKKNHHDDRSDGSNQKDAVNSI